MTGQNQNKERKAFYRDTFEKMPAETTTMRPGDINPYIRGSEQHRNWAAVCAAPDPDPRQQHLKCDRTTSSPCAWSKTHPLYDTCAVCKQIFAEWN